MRTRLDEIVEEISGKTPDTNWDYWSPYAVEVFGKIAERAFRHGVERTEEAYGYESRPNVQPAPAGEYRPCCSWCKTPGVGHIFCSDRRKGERRKHGEAKNYVHDWTYSAPSRPMYQKDLYGAFFYDRRSGKDRRK